MLNDCKNIYKKVADRIPDWKYKTKKELIDCYIANEHNKDYAESYFAAIMCKYWSAISNYYQTSYMSVTLADCHEWLTHALLYALKHRKWLDPNDTMYNDPNGADKIINRCIASTRKIFYQAANNNVHKVNYGTASIQQLQEDNLDYMLPSDSNFQTTINQDVLNEILIVNNCKQRDYLSAFVADGLLYGNVFDFDKTSQQWELNLKKLSKHLRTFDESYCKIFANNFNLDYAAVKGAADVYKNCSSTKIYKVIDKAFCILKQQAVKKLDMELVS